MTTKTPTATPATAWRNRITGSGEEAPDQLLANPANWRIHPKAQQDALAGALDQVGWVQQVLVNRRSGFVVDGHARVALALRRGEPTVPVLYVDLEPEEEALVLATLGSGSKEHKEDHPTQKPVVSEIPIRNHLRPGEAVYEPFSGSGTTIVAAETLGRRCYAMEIDPKYVQVAIERWQNFTGRQAERLRG